MIITGCNTSGCIRAATIDSFQYGYRTIIAEECVGDPEEQPHVAYAMSGGAMPNSVRSARSLDISSNWGIASAEKVEEGE